MGAPDVARENYHSQRWKSRLSPRSRGSAFTIIELLIIIAIISLLMGLLLPALMSSRRAARQMQCQSNLRQMAIAATQYSTLWDSYPAAIRYETRDGTVCRVAWDWVTTVSGTLIEPGALWQFTDNPDQVMQCPAYTGASNYSGDPYTGYNYNTSYIGGENYMGPVVNGKITNTAVHDGTKPHAIRNPQNTAFFGVGGYSAGANKFMRAPENPHGTSPWVTYSGGQAFLYNGETNVAWADAHVSAVQEGFEGVHATPALLKTLRYPQNGFLSNDDSAYDPQ